MCNSRVTMALATLIFSTLATGTSHAYEAVAEEAWERSTTCLPSVAGDMAGGARCVGNRMGGLFLDEATQFMTEQGRAMFGENFRLVHRMTWSPFGNGLAGELDMVVPLAAAGAARAGADVEELHGSAFFFQQGVTRWTDKHGLRRNDLRLGTAFRFTLPRASVDEEVFGVSALVQENVERGHQRLVFGMDYAGRWGRAALHHYTPTTNWRPGRSGYDERAVGGSELSLRFDLTSTLSLDTALGWWERDAAGRSAAEGRLGLGWRPHPYLRLNAGTGLGPDGESGSFLLSLNIPFGGPRKPPRWEGLGTFGAVDTSGGADMWRPVENVNRIQTIERVAAQEGAQEGDVSTRFLQSSAASGDEIGVEVSLSAPAAEDIRLSVSLAPGGGDNPAVAGVDFVDEPAIVTIREGDTSAQVTFQLLDNPDLSTDRTLSVSVTRV